MSQTTPIRAVARRVHPQRWPHRLIGAALVLSGAAASAWPIGETILSDQVDAGVVATYVATVRDTPAQVLSEELRQAEEYNAELPVNSLRDPWDGSPAEVNAAHGRYLRTLDTARAMGRIRIPAIDLDLPIFHDADALSMTYGVGHMYGSSLPVGGTGTHAVLAAHTGLSGRTRFDRLPELKVGDVFGISVAELDLTYRIDLIDVVEPWDLESVQRIPAEDYVTLVTCYTPPGSHKQRLLVRGTRVPVVAGAGTIATVNVAGSEMVVQPWMWPRLVIVGAALGILLAMMAAWVLGDRRSRMRQRGPRQPKARSLVLDGFEQGRTHQ